MSIWWQKTFRIVTPGIVVLVLAALTFSGPGTIRSLLSGSLELGKITLPLVAVLIFGFLIHEFVRPEFMNWAWERIDLNLKKQMVSAAKLSSENSLRILLSKKRLIRTFFTIIDSNETLKNSSDRARFNGFLLTTSADVEMLSFIFAALNLFLLCDELTVRRVVLAVFLFLIALFGKLLRSYFEEKHIRIGNEQIDLILTHHRTEFDKRINEHFLS